MSYLTLAAGIPNFSKAVISLWFRVPKATMDAAAAEPNPTDSGEVLSRCIPLLTFGKPQEAASLQPIEAEICPKVGVGPTIRAVVGFSPLETFAIDPSYIVIDCNDSQEGTGVLAFNIQMEDTGSGNGFFFDATSASAISFWTEPEVPSSGAISNIDALNDAVNTPGSGWTVKGETHFEINPDNPILAYRYFVHYNGITDFSSTILESRPESFHVRTLPRIKPDRWHHLLLSFDVSMPVVSRSPSHSGDPLKSKNWLNVSEGVSSYAKLWYALDDVDYRGRGAPKANGEPTYHMGPYSVDYDVTQFGGARPGGPPGDPNGILTRNAWTAAEQGSTPYHLNMPIAPISFSYFPGPIPSVAAAIGIPSSAQYVNHIYRVEMAELQIYTGVTLDTAIEGNRRAFVDNAGKPVDPTSATEDDPLWPGEKLLGKKPEILLHRSSNWKKGSNTGTLGLEFAGDGQIIERPAGQFVPTAKIEQYKPDPKLEEESTA